MNHPSNTNHSSDPAQIAIRAYEIYEGEGRRDGRATAHWLQAEAELAAPSVAPAPRRAEPPAAGSRRKSKKMTWVLASERGNATADSL